jgi:hypothetical protein
MRKNIFLLLTFVLSACVALPTPTPTSTASVPFTLKSADNSYAPKPEDASLQIGGVELTSLDLSQRVDMTPVRVELRVLGSLPRACNQLRIDVGIPNDQYQIPIKIYSLVDTKVKCENVFQQFEASILLGVYSAGRYTVWVNGGQVGDFVTY